MKSDPNTKTYPLNAIIGDEVDDYERGYAQGCEEGRERIAELADAFNQVCDENADFVAESIKDETRIAELEAQLKHAEGHAAELEAELTMRREQAEGLQNQWVKDTQKIVALEAEVKALRDSDYQRHARSLEQRLGLAVAALESVAVDSQERFIRSVARAALAQIEEGK
jgi:predicted  nucleic acid-binding Zn-ribbon protein